MIVAADIVKTFAATRALDGISFHIRQGESAALLGKNGAGKTTLIRILATCTRPSHGNARLNGFDIKKQPISVKKHIGLMSHSTFLYEGLTAEENLFFYGKMYGVSDLSSHIEKLLRQVGLHTRRHDPVRTFSHGMQKRLSIARAILHHPKILLMDEPFAGLDIQGKEILTTLLTKFISEGGTALLTTHDVEHALAHHSRILLLNRGRLTMDESVKKISVQNIKLQLSQTDEMTP